MSPTLPELSIQALSDAVTQHLKANGVSQFHLLGHSLGGKVAMQMAGNIPPAEHDQFTIDKLVIVDIAPRLYAPHHLAIIAALKGVALNEINSRTDAEKQLREQIPDAGIRGFLLKSLYRDDNNNYHWRFDLSGIASSYEAIRKAPDFAHKVLSPTLFIKGGKSDYLGAQDELPIRTHFQQPAFKEIGGAGHWPHAEKPALFTRLCLEFLSNSELPQNEMSANDAGKP